MIPLRRRALTLVVLATLGGSVPAAADHYRGVRATLVSQDPGTGQVTINVTVYTDGPGSAGESTGIGIDQSGQYRAAINWGDGLSTLSNTNVPFVDNGGPSGTARFRGTFSHTYASATQQTIRVSAGCCAGYQADSNNTGVAGNPVFALTGNGPTYQVGFTNTVQAFAAAPALPPSGLAALAALLAGAGVFTLLARRTPHHG
jgi:hypothetical protein